MNTEHEKKPSRGIYALPLLMALPVAAGMIIAAYMAWPTLQKLMNILIKMVVRP